MRRGRFIPPGDYCYSKSEPWGPGKPDGTRRLLDLCPFWSSRADKREQECGHCAYLGEGDWEMDGFGLLWDQCKECGINMDDS